ncbi:MAG: tetratricopeptide repeat protein [Planctomycetota bacterium]|jgi:hypothetical protein
MRALAALIPAAALLVPAALADTVTLKDGSQREGTVVRQDENEVVLRVASGRLSAEVTIPRAEVAAIRKGPTRNQRLLAEAAARRRKLKGRDAAGWLAYARWLDSHSGFTTEALGAFEKVVQIAPNNAAARERLGYVRDGKKWVRPGEKRPAPKDEPDAVLKALARIIVEGREARTPRYPAPHYYGYPAYLYGCGSPYYGYGYYHWPYSGYDYGSDVVPVLRVTGRNQLGLTVEMRLVELDGDYTYRFVPLYDYYGGGSYYGTGSWGGATRVVPGSTPSPGPFGASLERR